MHNETNAEIIKNEKKHQGRRELNQGNIEIFKFKRNMNDEKFNGYRIGGKDTTQICKSITRKEIKFE